MVGIGDCPNEFMLPLKWRLLAKESVTDVITKASMLGGGGGDLSSTLSSPRGYILTTFLASLNPCGKPG